MPNLIVNNVEINNRLATNNDLESLDLIYTQNMRKYVEKNYPWNATLFRDNFQSDRYTILYTKTEIIGFLSLQPYEDSLYLGEIQIANSYQNRGIGTKVLKTIIDLSENKYKEIYLKVLQGNPAITLYQKLGFTVFAESKTHYKMKFIPILKTSKIDSTLFLINKKHYNPC